MRTRSIRDPAMEHRWGQRIACRAAVLIRPGDGRVGEGRLRDVSASGAFVETAFPAPLLTRVSIAILRGVEATDAPREIRASIVRRDSDGIALEWCETPGSSICTDFGCESHCATATATR
jgi:hypothetical protein